MRRYRQIVARSEVRVFWAVAERERDGRHPAMGGICRHDLRRADLGCPGAATHHRLGFRRAERSIHNLDIRRLSNRGICADGAKSGGDAHQPVRHLSMADLEGKGMKKPGARRSADPPLWVIAYPYPERS